MMDEGQERVQATYGSNYDAPRADQGAVRPGQRLPREPEHQARLTTLAAGRAQRPAAHPRSSSQDRPVDAEPVALVAAHEHEQHASHARQRMTRPGASTYARASPRAATFPHPSQRPRAPVSSSANTSLEHAGRGVSVQLLHVHLPVGPNRSVLIRSGAGRGRPAPTRPLRRTRSARTRRCAAPRSGGEPASRSRSASTRRAYRTPFRRSRVSVSTTSSPSFDLELLAVDHVVERPRRVDEPRANVARARAAASSAAARRRAAADEQQRPAVRRAPTRSSRRSARGARTRRRAAPRRRDTATPRRRRSARRSARGARRRAPTRSSTSAPPGSRPRPSAGRRRAVPARCPFQPSTSRTSVRVRGVSSTTSATRARRATSVAPVPLLPPRIAVVVVAVALPEAGLVIVAQCQPAHPLRALPEVEVRHEQPCRAPCSGSSGSPS